MKKFRAVASAFLMWTLIASSCSGGPEPPAATTTTTTVVDPSVVLEDHSITFTPEEDSFSFEII